MSQLAYTMFQDVLFPKSSGSTLESPKKESFLLQRIYRNIPQPQLEIQKTPIVIFDFETTGLKPPEDKIIEIGALKLVLGHQGNFEDFEKNMMFETLINPEIRIPSFITEICGIDDTMVINQPTIQEILPRFLRFIQGSLLVAHNAEFDLKFFKTFAELNGFKVEVSALCTLKMARNLLPSLERKTLDALAEHYELKFEARHRSVGDAKVTGAVLAKMLTLSQERFRYWRDLELFMVS